MTQSRLIDFVIALSLAAAIAAVYAPASRAPFIFDDRDSIVGNPSIVRLWPLVGDVETGGPLNPRNELPTSGRPLVNLSLAVNYQLGRLDPLGYHVLNCVVHWLSAVVVAAILGRILRLEFFGRRFDGAASALAFVVALLWSVHPLAPAKDQ